MQIFVDADACPVVGKYHSFSGLRCFSNGTWKTAHKNHIKGPRKRTEEDDERFAQSFEKMILMVKSKEGGQIGTV